MALARSRPASRRPRSSSPYSVVKRLRIQPVLAQPAHHHGDAAVRDEDALARRCRRWPAAARASRRGRTCTKPRSTPRRRRVPRSCIQPVANASRVVAEAPQPRRALRRRRRQHQRALQQRGIDARIGHAQRRRQRHAGRAIHARSAARPRRARRSGRSRRPRRAGCAAPCRTRSRSSTDARALLRRCARHQSLISANSAACVGQR